MALKKIKPISPDIYLGKTVGDNEVARLAHVNDIVSKFRKTWTFEVPTSGSTVNIYPNHVETIVIFDGLLVNEFTINIVVDARFSPNLEPGDKMYIFLNGPSGIGTNVTFTGAVSVTVCGDTDNVYRVDTPVCLEVIYNGSQFIGIDIC
jgi:hypothetical protein